MKAKHLYKIINEEITDFDFLNMNRVQKETDTAALLHSKEFQVKLIDDICHDDKSSMNDIDVTYREEDKDNPDNSEFEFYIEFDYDFSGVKVPIFITVEGSLNFLEDSALTFFSVDGQKVDFKWIEKNEGLKKKIVECLVSEFTK